jgi:hypothetical protein
MSGIYAIVDMEAVQRCGLQEGCCMSDWREVSRVNSRDGMKYMSVHTRDNMFCFVEHTQFTEVEPYQTYTYFSPTHQSGLYESAEDAERDARLELPWLREQISN